MSYGPDGLVRFNCSGCGGKAKADPKHAGFPVKCPKCGAETMVPGTMYLEPADAAELIGEVVESPPLLNSQDPPPILNYPQSSEYVADQTAGWHQPFRSPAVNVFINNARRRNPRSVPAALIGGGIGVVGGGVLGAFASQYFPFFGGFFAHVAEPFSRYRLELLPTHVIVCGLTAGAIGAGIAHFVTSAANR